MIIPNLKSHDINPYAMLEIMHWSDMGFMSSKEARIHGNYDQKTRGNKEKWVKMKHEIKVNMQIKEAQIKQGMQGNSKCSGKNQSTCIWSSNHKNWEYKKRNQ